KSLHTDYRTAIDESLKGERELIRETVRVRREMFHLDSEALDRAMEEIGSGIAAMHFYIKGGLNLRSCLELVKTG
ncbi:hypothetical protein ACFL7M_19420, partial [Thermodesulfobacteriota bacterium]